MPVNVEPSPVAARSSIYGSMTILLMLSFFSCIMHSPAMNVAKWYHGDMPESRMPCQIVSSLIFNIITYSLHSLIIITQKKDIGQM